MKYMPNEHSSTEYDIDKSTQALHHTLGNTVEQAAAGSHTHAIDDVFSTPIFNGKEVDIRGIPLEEQVTKIFDIITAGGGIIIITTPPGPGPSWWIPGAEYPPQALYQECTRRAALWVGGTNQYNDYVDWVQPDPGGLYETFEPGWIFAPGSSYKTIDSLTPHGPSSPNTYIGAFYFCKLDYDGANNAIGNSSSQLGSSLALANSAGEYSGTYTFKFKRLLPPFPEYTRAEILSARALRNNLFLTYEEWTGYGSFPPKTRVNRMFDCNAMPPVLLWEVIGEPGSSSSIASSNNPDLITTSGTWKEVGADIYITDDPSGPVGVWNISYGTLPQLLGTWSKVSGEVIIGIWRTQSKVLTRVFTSVSGGPDTQHMRIRDAVTGAIEVDGITGFPSPSWISEMSSNNTSDGNDIILGMRDDAGSYYSPITLVAISATGVVRPVRVIFQGFKYDDPYYGARSDRFELGVSHVYPDGRWVVTYQRTVGVGDYRSAYVRSDSQTLGIIPKGSEISTDGVLAFGKSVESINPYLIDECYTSKRMSIVNAYASEARGMPAVPRPPNFPDTSFSSSEYGIIGFLAYNTKGAGPLYTQATVPLGGGD